MFSPIPQILHTPEREALKASVASYLDEVLPYDTIRQLDEDDAFPRDVWEGLGKLGVHGIGVSEELGGSGGTAADALVVLVEIAKRFPSLSVDYVLCGMVARMLDEVGTPEQKRWLEPLASGRAIYAYGISEPGGGTDALALRTRARETDGGWLVSGTKLWSSLANEAEMIFTLARTDAPEPPERRARGITVIAVPTDQVGVHIRRVHLGGMRAAGTCEVFFDDAFAPADNLVGERGRGFNMLRSTLDVERILAAGISLGIGQAALELAFRYAKEREAFGRPIGAFQALQHSLVDATTQLAGAFLLVERAVQIYESGGDATAAAGLGKLAAAEAAAVVVDRGMRVMAAMGLARESPMQMFFRDARLQLFAPVSNEMLRNVLGEAMGLPRSY